MNAESAPSLVDPLGLEITAIRLCIMMNRFPTGLSDSLISWTFKLKKSGGLYDKLYI